VCATHDRAVVEQADVSLVLGASSSCGLSGRAG
jgi:hypothetical protein